MVKEVKRVQRCRGVRCKVVGGVMVVQRWWWSDGGGALIGRIVPRHPVRVWDLHCTPVLPCTPLYIFVHPCTPVLSTKSTLHSGVSCRQ